MRLVTDMRLLKAFANTAAELLGFIETALHLLKTTPSSNGTTGANDGTAVGNASTTGSSTGLAPPSGSDKLGALWQHNDVRGAVEAAREHRQRKAFRDDEQQITLTWPGQEDPFLNSLLIQYATLVTGSQPGAVQGDKKATLTPLNSAISATSVPAPSSSAAASGGAGGGVQGPAGSAQVWTEAVVGELIAMLWVMHLRSLCALRGLRPSEVLGATVLESLHRLQQQQQYLGRSDPDKQVCYIHHLLFGGFGLVCQL